MNVNKDTHAVTSLLFKHCPRLKGMKVWLPSASHQFQNTQIYSDWKVPPSLPPLSLSSCPHTGSCTPFVLLTHPLKHMLTSITLYTSTFTHACGHSYMFHIHTVTQTFTFTCCLTHSHMHKPIATWMPFSQTWSGLKAHLMLQISVILPEHSFYLFLNSSQHHSVWTAHSDPTTHSPSTSQGSVTAQCILSCLLGLRPPLCHSLRPGCIITVSEENVSDLPGLINRKK